MTRISRYLLRHLTLAMAVVTLGLAAAIWLTQSLRLVELVVEGGAPLSLFAKLAMLTLPTFLANVLPVGVLVAVLFTYHRLIQDHEIVVMRAAGVGPMALARPALALALIVSLICFLLTVHLAPAANRELVRLRTALQNGYSGLLLQEGTFNDIGKGLTVYVREKRPGGDLLGLLIHDARNPDVIITVVADRGRLSSVEDLPRVVVLDGTQMTYYPRDGRQDWLEFASYTVDIQVLDRSLVQRRPEPRERSLRDLLFPVADGAAAGQVDRLRAELHGRLSLPLLSLAFACIALAALLPAEFARRGHARVITTAVLCAVAIQGTLLGLNGLTAKVPALIPLLYLVVIIPGIVAFVLVRRGRRFSRQPPASRPFEPVEG